MVVSKGDVMSSALRDIEPDMWEDATGETARVYEQRLAGG
jgi:hypothetical protein